MGYHCFHVPYTAPDGHAVDVCVEVAIHRGIPHMEVLGATNRQLRESVHRVKSALLSNGYKVPPKRILINLTPANVAKQGDRFDLAIAYALMREQGAPTMQDVMPAGGLTLNGELLPCALSMSEQAITKGQGLGNGLGGTWWQLSRLGSKAKQTRSLEVAPRVSTEVVGQDHAKRILQAATLAQVPVLLVGPPGYGKTLLSRLFTSGETLTQLSTPMRIAKLRSQRIQSAQEIQLWSMRCIQSLQAVLEGPSFFVATANRCLCGREGMTTRQCTCRSADRQRYAQRLSEPLIDRFAAVVPVGPEFLHDYAVAMQHPLQATQAASLDHSMRKQELIKKLARGLSQVDGLDRATDVHVAEAQLYADVPW